MGRTTATPGKVDIHHTSDVTLFRILGVTQNTDTLNALSDTLEEADSHLRRYAATVVCNLVVEPASRPRVTAHVHLFSRAVQRIFKEPNMATQVNLRSL